jgi:site-specific recombinase XerD
MLMKLSVVYLPAACNSVSPYRLLDEHGREVVWVNAFLDAKHLLQHSPRSLRAYAFGLLHFARWAQAAADAQPPRQLVELNDASLRDYLRFQLQQQPCPAPQTINYRLDLLRVLYRFHFACEIPGEARFQHYYTTRSPLGYGRPGRAATRGLRLREPRTVMLPLPSAAVAQFWESFHTFRDLALVGLMLYSGLRSGEVLALQLADVRLAEGQMLVRGKGNKQRLLPLPQDLGEVLQKYLWLERPLTASPALFVCLKGRSRGAPLTLAGLRSLFRYHRRTSQIPQANPHRFRHTFGADMVRAGISLPALQQLMGHSQIRTTMRYVQLAPEDVWRAFRDAIEKRSGKPRCPGSDHA